MDNPAKQQSNTFGKSLRVFFFLFLLLGIVLGGGVFTIYTYFSKGQVHDLLVREKYGVELRRTMVKDSLNTIASDLDFLASLQVVERFSIESDPAELQELTDDFLQFVKAKGVYDQARFLNASGMEMVRVNYNGGLPSVVPEKLLQNKGQRYYFTDTMLLEKGEVFVSPLDLNFEKGKVEIPYKPVIRFGTPIYGPDGKPKGAIILNYRADNLLGLLRRTGRATAGQTMLLNNRGYWLLSPDTADQWGFLLPNRKDVSFANRFPKLWIDMRGSDSGQVVSGNKVFTYTTVYPLNTRFRSSTGSSSAYAQSSGTVLPDQYFWKLVSYVPNSRQQGYTPIVMTKIFGLGAIVFIVSGGLSWLLALAFVRRRLYKSCVIDNSHVDSLTNLPNRRMFFDRYAQKFENAERYGQSFGLLYIDVDEFKHINDTLGVDAGDELLVELSRRLMRYCRKSDTIARIGGDEFVVILSQVHDRSSCEAAVAKIMEAMRDPFLLGVDDQDVTISIGVSIYPADSADRDALLTRADKAMLKAKLAGKGQVSYDPE